MKQMFRQCSAVRLEHSPCKEHTCVYVLAVRNRRKTVLKGDPGDL